MAAQRTDDSSPRTDKPSSQRVSRLHRALEEHVANPLFVFLLRTRLHFLASRWLVLLSYVGPKSGRRYTFPVAYALVDGDVIVVTPMAESNWWRNFTAERTCKLWLQGTPLSVRGHVLEGTAQDGPLEAYFARYPTLGRGLGFGRNAPRSRDQLDEMKAELAVVRFERE